jgi:hypothetical protein
MVQHEAFASLSLPLYLAVYLSCVSQNGEAREVLRKRKQRKLGMKRERAMRKMKFGKVKSEK